MAELDEAFFCLNKDNINLENIDYFFTQRNMKESHEYLDKNMNRKNKQVNIIYNFLAISIPIYAVTDNNEFTYNIQIFGDSGYHYKGSIKSFKNTVPNLMIPLKGDKKIFIHINYNENNIKESICFIEVPKRFQSIDLNTLNLKSDSETKENN